MSVEQAKAELARRQNMAAAKAELERRQSAQPKADMSFMGRVKDNVIGVDDGVMSTGEKIATALNQGGESLTMGVVGDEAAAAADSLVGRGTYDERLAHHRANEAQFRQENPALSLGAEVAPAVIPGVGAAGAVAKVAGVTGRTVAGAGAGATAGATYGFAEGEGGVDERMESARWSALAGTLLGGVAPKLLDGAASLPRKLKQVFSKSVERPTIPLLKAAKNSAYQAVDRSGFSFDGKTMTDLAGRVRTSFADNNYVEETDGALTATLKLLDARAGKPTSLSQLDKLRQNLWKRYGNAKDQPQILDAIKAIDETIDQAGTASDLMGAARAANARYAKSQLLDDAFRKADDQVASTGSGGNVVNKYRQAVTSIINNDKKAKFFSEDEIEMMREFVRGSNSENVKRLVGKMSPSGNGLMLTLHTIAGVSTSGATVPLMAVGAVSKASADKAVKKGASDIQDYLAGLPRQPKIETNAAPLSIGSAPLSENAQDAIRNGRN